MGGRLLHDPPAQFLINRRIIIIVAACSMAVQNTVLAGIKHFRVLRRQPCRRRCGRRSENHLHSHPIRQIQKTVKKAVVKLPFPGLDLIPRELGNADRLDPVFQHPRQILLPEFLFPVLRIITGPQSDTFSIQNLHVKILLCHPFFPLYKFHTFPSNTESVVTQPCNRPAQ